MVKRFVSIWFRHLRTDWFTLHKPELSQLPFVLALPDHGRMVIEEANAIAQANGINKGMALADARAVLPALQAMDDQPDLTHKLLNNLAEWCIRFTPTVAVDLPDGLLLETTGCSHLWGGDERYLEAIVGRLNTLGYNARAAMSDTPGVAWAMARYGEVPLVVRPGMHVEAVIQLPPVALRLETETVERLHKLGLHRISQFFTMPRAMLRRRFGPDFLKRLDLVLGRETEIILPIHPLEPYQERLPSLDPIVNLAGIEIALDRLLRSLCHRLQQEQKGLRECVLKVYRVDGKMEQVGIGTHRPTHHVNHLFKLFDLKVPAIDPGLGIELFVLEASKVEDHLSRQEKLWEQSGGLDDERLSELVDRLSGKAGIKAVRYLPAEHYWPERSFKEAASLHEPLESPWRVDWLRPLQLLALPERIEVTAPIPDYPPMLFKYRGKLHRITKADGPERIEQEWWLQKGEHRDYYRVEDEDGNRYWLFRLGHYDDKNYEWFLHGFFA